MKILQIISSLRSGGAERFVVDLSNELLEQHHEVILCVMNDEKDNGFYKNEVSKNITYINLNIHSGFSFYNIYKFFKLIKQLKPNIIHFHLTNYLFALFFFFNKINFFYTVHSSASREVSNKVEFLIKKFIFNFNKIHVITISNETSLSFKRYFNCSKYIEIYNGRKKPTISNDINDVTNFFKQLGKGNNSIFIHIARCAPVKNQEMLVKVFNRLIIQDKMSIILLIIGADFDSALGRMLKALANDKIYFIGQKHNIGDYYLNADAFCLSSLNEGMPITLIEALSLGCTPICTPVGGIIDTIENGITGFLSKSITEEDYYQTMKNYLLQKKRINQENLITYYNNHFGIEECAKKHIQLYNKYVL